jgi:hypothetical protein
MRNSVQNTPLFRQDLGAPYGSAGEFDRLEDMIGMINVWNRFGVGFRLVPSARAAASAAE